MTIATLATVRGFLIIFAALNLKVGSSLYVWPNRAVSCMKSLYFLLLSAPLYLARLQDSCHTVVDALVVSTSHLFFLFLILKIIFSLELSLIVFIVINVTMVIIFTIYFHFFSCFRVFLVVVVFFFLS